MSHILDRRREPRRHLFAQVQFGSVLEGSTEEGQYTGTCKCLSTSGMLIASEFSPVHNGAGIRMMVVPPAHSGIWPFEAVAQVVRVTSEPNGFAVQFTEISEFAKEQIRLSISNRTRLPITTQVSSPAKLELPSGRGPSLIFGKR